MRVIKFRGKDPETGQWFYGHYTEGAWIDPTDGTEVKRHIIHGEDGFLHDIDPETLGQLVEEEAFRGKPVYEGDILLSDRDMRDGRVFVVEWDECEYEYILRSKGDWIVSTFGNAIQDIDRLFEVIGNIYDNPELMEEEGK